MSSKSAIRGRTRDEHGFTLIELLVVILIIGVLAAIVIPSFLNQKGKATDAAAKELTHSMQVAAESYASDNGGSYANLTATVLNQYESTIQLGSGGNNAYVSLTNWGSSTASSYTVTATAATTGDTFSIIHASSGTLTRQCKTVAATPSGCTALQNATASW